jgi:hypothetical protein
MFLVITSVNGESPSDEYLNVSWLLNNKYSENSVIAYFVIIVLFLATCSIQVKMWNEVKLLHFT